MSRLEELIEKLCPDGVEYKKIAEVADVSIGEFVHKSKQNPDSQYPVFNGGTSNTGFYDEYNRTANKIIISARGANAGFVNRVFTNFWSGNSCYTVDFSNDAVNWNFAFYWLKSKEKKLLGEQQKGGIPAVSKKQVESFLIPVPPIEVQDEIVKILDNFTELTAELTEKLTAELTARKKQYEYYKSKLFDFDNSTVEIKPLGDEFSFIRNGFVGTATPYYTDKEQGVRYLKGTNIHNGVISDNEEEYITQEFHQKHIKNQLKPDDILVVQSGHVGECAVVGDKYAGANCHALIIMSNDGNCNSKYVVYYLQTEEGKKKLARITTGGTIKHILASGMKKLTIPFPPLEEQQRIVDILDRFDRLCNDISEGLPAEIEARQKQYEYYRDKLLTFKEIRNA